MAFAERLRLIMDARGVDQTALASKLGITSQAVSQWVNGPKPTMPRGKRLRDIATILQVSIPELMADDGAPFGEISELNPVLLAPDEAKLIEAVRSMDPHRARALMLLVGADPAKPPPSTAGPTRPFVVGGVQEEQADCGNVIAIPRRRP